MNLRFFLFFLFLSNITKSQNFSQKLYPDDPEQGAFFGRFVVQNDEYAIISAYKDSERANSSGAIYVYHMSNGIYIQTQKLFPEDGTVEQFFGYSLGINSDWIVAGAHHDSSKGASSGAAYIIKKNTSGSWNIVQKLVPNDLSEGDEFGKKVSLYGDFLVSASYLDDDNGINSGQVYVYKLENDSWYQYARIKASTPSEYSQFGLSLDIYRDKLIVGAPFEGAKEKGAAYIYEYNNNQWEEVLKLRPDDLNEYDQFGTTVKINDNFVFVSSTKNDNLGENSGIVYVYERINGDWQYLQSLNAPDEEEGDGFGIDIAVSDSILTIGSYFDDDNGQNSGSIYLYKLTSGIWRFYSKISPDDGEESDAFGVSISIKNNNLLVGAYSDSDKGFLSGSAYLFTLNKVLNNEYINNNERIRVYPNIVFDNTNIESNMPYLHLVLYNIFGTAIEKRSILKGKSVLSLSKYPSGLYLCKVFNKDFSKIFKLIKSDR